VLPFQPLLDREQLFDEHLQHVDKHRSGRYRLSEQDTFRAVYRLSLAGLVQDYTVDYSKQQIQLKLQRLKPTLEWKEAHAREKDRYINYVFNYLARYESEKRVLDRMKQALSPPVTEEERERDGQHAELLRMVDYLIQYAYDQIVAKRKRAMHDMHTACLEAVNKGNEAFAEFIDLYFNSKYARPAYEIDGQPYSLYDDTEGGRVYERQLLDKYLHALEIDSSGSFIDNVKHLRGASLRLLRDNPENPLLHLLQAFTLYALTFSSEAGRYQEERGRARQAALEGLRLLQQSETLKFDDLVSLQNAFRKALEGQVATHQSETSMEALLSELEDLFWLGYFNQAIEQVVPKLRLHTT
jgi:ATP-dependent DNA helicase RecQ